jgi:hypothetical protein
VSDNVFCHYLTTACLNFFGVSKKLIKIQCIFIIDLIRQKKFFGLPMCYLAVALAYLMGQWITDHNIRGSDPAIGSNIIYNEEKGKVLK